MKLITKYSLLLILLLASGLRLILITQSPPSLYWEEVALGYDAYSVLKTGKDFHGNPLPVVAFESYGDWKPSGYYYALIPFIAVFGLSPLGVRLPSALAGILTVYLVYLITLEMGKRKSWALGSALVLAILPWHIQFSRAGFEVNLATGLLTAGVYCLLKARSKPGYFFPAMLLMIGSMYTYHGLRVLAPLVAGLCLLLYGKMYLRRKSFYLSLILGVFLVIPIIVTWQTPMIQERINETSVFSTSQAVPVTNALRLDDGNTWWSHLVHHRYWYWGKEILSGAVSHFNPGFLFITGDNTNRHQTGYVALLYIFMIVPLIWGMGLILTGKERPAGWLLIWTLLASLPPALTNVTPHTLRFLPAAPAFAIIIGLGLEALWLKVKSPSGRTGIIVVMVGFLLPYIYDLWWVYPKRTSEDWQYGYQQVIQFIKPDYQQHVPIYFTNTYGRAFMYVLFYLQIDPQLVQKASSTLPKDQGELLAFDSFKFGPPPVNPKGTVVSDTPRADGQLVDTVNFLDGKPAFYVYHY